MTEGPELFDALSCEVAQHRLTMLAEEGGLRAARSAGSAFVSGNSSVASAIFNREGLMIAQTRTGLQHVSALRSMMPEILRDYPVSGMRDGDVFLCNDQFRGGIHPTDLGSFRPIFWRGEVAFFSAILMIVADMGGISSGGLPATATEVFQEGLVVPPVRLYDAGVLNPSVMALLLGNSRVPDKLRTDVDALVGAGAIVGQRLIEMVDRYGLGELSAIIARLFDHTEAIVRSGLAAIPDGEYVGSYLAEDDGVGPAPSYEVRVRIAIQGSDCTVDFTGSSVQAPGAINSSISQSLSCVTFALRCYLSAEIEMNEGFYRAFTTVFPLGSVVNPVFPAACNLRFSIGQAMVDAIHGALRPIFPNRSVAPSSSIGSINVNGATPGLETQWAMLDVLFGPSGGRPGADANDGLPFQMIGGSSYMTIEAYESLFPIIYEKFGLLPDSSGPGEWRGGAGVQKQMRFLEDAVVTLRAVDRTKLHPLGAEGGDPGRGGGWVHNPGQPDEKRLPPKLTNYSVKAGDVMNGSMSGGGGYGPPLRRDPERVASDVRAGFVTPAGAAADYGVVVSPAGAVDLAATQELRSKRHDA